MKIGELDQSLRKGSFLSISSNMNTEKHSHEKGHMVKSSHSKNGSYSPRRMGLRFKTSGLSSDRRRAAVAAHRKNSHLYKHDKYKSKLRENRSFKSKIRRGKKRNPISEEWADRDETTRDQGASSNAQAKPAQSTIPIQQFWSYTSQYFRPITEDDLKLLAEDQSMVTPYIIPSLGKHYTEQWKEDVSPKKVIAKKSHPEQAESPNNEFSYMEHDGIVYPGNVELKPLSERVLSSLVEEYILNYPLEKEEPPAKDTPPAKVAAVRDLGQSFADLEERLRLELKHIGLIDTDDGDEAEGGEIVEELRELQLQLRCQIATNNIHKRKLRDVALKWMAKQELDVLISTNDKHIEKSYSRKFKYPKTKGRKRAHTDYYPSAEAVAGYLKNRERLIKEIGSFFRPESLTIS